VEQSQATDRSAAASIHVRDLPKTAKGKRSRHAILTTARASFGKVGYSATRVQDIVDGAGLSLGAFYRYFDGRREVLLAILAGFFDELYEASRSPWVPDDPKHSVRETTLRYLQAYADNADLYRVAYETFLTEPDVNRIWDDARQMFYRRIERSLRRGQEMGDIRPDLDPVAVAILLGGMTEHYAFLAFVIETPVAAASLDHVADEIGALWVAGVS
jgi:AcrR family transcriptional regulator